MRKPSKIEAIRFQGFVFRHFGNGCSNDKGQTWYLFDDDYKRYYDAIWSDKNTARREKCLLIKDVYKLFKLVEKEFGVYGSVDDDLVVEYLCKKLPVPKQYREW